MDLALNRRSGVPVRDQLVTQMELRILDGTLRPEQRLPSVRALARRLKVHANTVSAAYRDLEAAGHVRLRRGSGVYVTDAGAQLPQDARSLDEMIRLTLRLALRKGFAAGEIRAAVERWLAAAPPDRIVVVDPVPDMAEVLVRELREALRLPVASCTIEDLRADPSLLAGGLALVLPTHLHALREAVPDAPAEVVHLQLAEADRQAIQALAAGSIVLVVASSPSLLPFAQVVLKGVRGDEILLETRLLRDARGWRRLLAAADVVFADAIAAPAVRRAAPRRLREVRVVPGRTLERLRRALEFVTPR